MSEAATREDIDEVIGILRDFMTQVDQRFTRVEYEITDLKHEVTDLKDSHNRLLSTIDGFIGRIDRYETELAARDSQFERLLVWARKVSKKTGIPLEDL